MLLTIQTMQRFVEQLRQAQLLRLFQRFLRQAAFKHLLDLQLAQRLAPLARQDAFTLGAAAAPEAAVQRNAA